MKVWLPLIRTGTGAEVYTRRLAEGLTASGHDVVLDEVPHPFQYFPWLAPVRAPHDADVVVANSWNAAAFKTQKLPLITIVHHVVHDLQFDKYKSFMQKYFYKYFVKFMEKSAINQSQRIISVSHSTQSAIREFLSEREISVVLNGVETDFFTPNEMNKLGTGNEPIQLLFVGKPSRRKGFDLVAKIVEGLGNRVRLTCVGPLPSGNLARPPGRYLGRVSRDDLRQAYREADLLLFPSRLEGFGYVAAEALACGLPVVSVKGTAVEEIAPPPDCGTACEAEDVGAFIEAIDAIAADPSRLQEMRKCARAHAVAKLDAKRWIKEMEAEIASAIHGSGNSPG